MSSEVIVISGISSFVGANLAIHFTEQGHKVCGLISKDLSSYDGLRKLRLNGVLSSGAEVLTLDLTDKKKTQELISVIKPSVWFQHAAWTENANSLDFDLNRAILVNVSSLKPIYAALSQCGCKGIIITGTNAEYGDKQGACFESDICMPTTPYGLSKLSSTLRASQLAEEYNLNTRIARIYNPIGPFDNPKKLLPTVIQNLKEDRLTDLSPCDQKRDFLYVSELLDGFQLLLNDLEREVLFEIFNICSGQAISVKEILIDVAKIMMKEDSLLNFGAHPMREGEPEVSFGSNKKARDLLGWNPSQVKQSLENIIEEIINEKQF